MQFDKRRQFPKLRIVNLLTFTAACTVGLAASFSPPPNLQAWESDMRWQQGLMCGGVVLLAYELIRQAVFLTVVWRSTESKMKDAIAIAVIQRLVFGVLIAGLVFLRLMLNWKVIVDEPRIEYPHVYIEFWPDLILATTTIAALRMLMIHDAQREFALLSRVLSMFVIFVGTGLTAIYIFTDRAEEVALTHFATEDYETKSPLSIQRLEYFPRSNEKRGHLFYLSASAASGIVLGAVLLWLHAKTKLPWVRSTTIAIIFLLVSIGGAYGYWFFFKEFPRISPDIASVGSARLWSDTLAGFMLLVGLATYFGLSLARVRERNQKKYLPSPRLSCTGLFAAYVIAFASGCNANVLLSLWTTSDSPHSILSFLVWSLPLPYWSSWENYAFTFSEAISQPEMLLTLMLFITAISLVWQNYRRRDIESFLLPVHARQVVGYSLASLALMIVAIPIFTAFAFCYWLGPIVL